MVMALSRLKPGQEGRITRIEAIGPWKRRLMDMGVLVGEGIKVEKIAPLGDPIEVTIKGYHLSLRKKEMEGDNYILKDINISDNGLFNEAIHQLKRVHSEDIESIMADTRYSQAAGVTHEVFKKPDFRKMELTEKIDRIVLNRFFGIPIFLAAMWLVFKFTFDVSTPFVDWIDTMTAGPFKRWAEFSLNLINAPDWMVSLASDGIIAGVGFVIVFVPVIFAMMFFITFLEGSGYMARAAFVMDRAMRTVGLHGKSFIPMLLGFGCNVPAIYATRILESPRDKALRESSYVHYGASPL